MAAPDSTTFKTCVRCKQQFPATPYYFHRHPETNDGLHSWCKRCKSEIGGHKFKSWDTPAPDGFRRCSDCKEVKPLNEFHRNKRLPDGYHYACKQCRAKAEGFNYKPPVPEGHRRCAHCKQVFPATTEYFYLRPDTGALNSHCIPCYLERHEEHRKAHPEWTTAGAHARRARKLFNGGAFTGEDVKRQYSAQKGLCWWCGKKVGKKYHADHIIPLAKGGSNDAGNICISCPKCNQRKGAKMPWEFNGRLF